MILVSVLVLLLPDPGLGSRRAGPCLPVCSGGECITVNRDRVDFKTAEEACRNQTGVLLTLQSQNHQRIFEVLTKQAFGNFWIGLRLPSGSCSDLSVPLRGYEWTSGDPNGTYIPSKWTAEAELCSPRCVSLSYQRWEERFCSDHLDGFLCRSEQKFACRGEDRTFKSSAGCRSGPCEQQCSDVGGGFKCSCVRGYRTDLLDPRRCRQFCGEGSCPALCEGERCSCPDGFVLSGRTCEDVDECEMGQCSGGCVNSFGSFMCFCPEGFRLHNEVRCVPVRPAGSSTTPAAEPVSKNGTLKVSTVPKGVFLWIWVVVAVTLVASVVLIRFYVVKRQKRNQPPAAPAEDATGS
uniref:CD93 molecule n=2 Tax=Nothobranchius kadleci TaxID=1051664 RepID=A0A1A8BHY8_NOTKA